MEYLTEKAVLSRLSTKWAGRNCQVLQVTDSTNIQCRRLAEEGQPEGTLVLADIKCGTPYQSAAYLSKTYKMALVTGMNLPMLLSAVLERDETDTLETISARAADNENYGIERTISGEGVKKQRAKLSINKS